VTQGVGQFCTNPGLVIAVCSAELNVFEQKASFAFAQTEAAAMLSSEIKDRYESGSRTLASQQGVELLSNPVQEDASGTFVLPAFFKISAEDFMRNPLCQQEIFGPSSLLV